MCNFSCSGWFIEFFTPGSTMSRQEAYFHGSGVVLCAAVYTFTHHPYFFGVMHMGMKLRVANCSLVYRSRPYQFVKFGVVTYVKGFCLSRRIIHYLSPDHPLL